MIILLIQELLFGGQAHDVQPGNSPLEHVHTTDWGRVDNLLYRQSSAYVPHCNRIQSDSAYESMIGSSGSGFELQDVSWSPYLVSSSASAAYVNACCWMLNMPGCYWFCGWLVQHVLKVCSKAHYGTTFLHLTVIHPRHGMNAECASAWSLWSHLMQLSIHSNTVDHSLQVQLMRAWLSPWQSCMSGFFYCFSRNEHLALLIYLVLCNAEAAMLYRASASTCTCLEHANNSRSAYRQHCTTMSMQDKRSYISASLGTCIWDPTYQGNAVIWCVHRNLPFVIADAFLTSVDTT